MKENYIGSIGKKYSIVLNKCKGGYGQVFLVEENETHKEYAAKILTKTNHYESEVEINNTLKKLKIPNIVEFEESGEDDIIFENENIGKMKYLIVKYYSKKDLLKYIYFSGGLTETHSKVLFKYILETIQQMHKYEIYHLDLKLNNILLDDKFIPKIADFGFSKTIKESINKKFKGSFGTKWFKPPQMHLREPFDGSKADIFSLGVLLFFLVTKEYPFDKAIEEDDFYGFIKNHNYEEFWKKHKKAKSIEVSEELQKLFVKMVAFEEDERPPDIETILSDKWFVEIKNLDKEKKKKLEEEYISEFIEKEKKMNDQLNPTKEAKENDVKNESYNAQSFANIDNIVYVINEKIFDYYIKIKGNFNAIDFMNKFANEMEDLYDDIKIDDKNFKLNVIIKMEDKNKGNKNENKDKKKDIDFIHESSGENEKEVNILVELFKTKNSEYILNFIKEKGELSDFYQKLSCIMEYAQKLI